MDGIFHMQGTPCKSRFRVPRYARPRNDDIREECVRA
ncbi:MAG: hypothetical protein OJF55_001836 [Rhodanobacteraceae bacterium]|jgi:hypothetical protein|nr:MAG: hypothetical protein OJF55_001836 [Rhodanobacteraceae bacterium]